MYSPGLALAAQLVFGDKIISSGQEFEACGGTQDLSGTTEEAKGPKSLSVSLGLANGVSSKWLRFSCQMSPTPIPSRPRVASQWCRGRIPSALERPGRAWPIRAISTPEKADMHPNKPFLIRRQGQHMVGEDHCRAE